MKKSVISIEKCSPGMQVAEEIANEFGGIIVPKDAILDWHYIHRLQQLSVFTIKVYDLTEEQILQNRNSFVNEYKESVHSIKEIFTNITLKNFFKVEQIRPIVNSLISNLSESRNVLDCLKQVKDVDNYTFQHSINVALLSSLIAKWCEFETTIIRQLAYAGILHDIGKAKVPADILNKPGKLDSREYEEIRKHPIYGFEILKYSTFLDNNIKLGVLMHHEREDGKGYPLALTSEQIHTFAKIIAIADIFDAMVSDRVYHNGECPFTVLEYMENGSFGQLDIKILRTFLSHMANYYIGNKVKLNDARVGEIIFINPQQVAKPLIKVGDEYIDLIKCSDLRIVALINQ